MDTAIITGSAGLIGSESARFFSKKGFKIVGIDNNMRKEFFGEEGCTNQNRKKLKSEIDNYVHQNVDIRDKDKIEIIFKIYGKSIKTIIHCAAQPSHDWAVKDPFTDFSVNATGTLVLLEMTRKYCPDAVFIFTSTNKVYGDLPNKLPLIESYTRYDIGESHKYHNSIDESMSIDKTKHSIFGASKVAADIMVQEYGRYFGMKTVCFRCGCLTGSGHSSTELHGFLAYLMKCCITGKTYTIFGYKGKQVRDNIHSFDLVNAFWHFYKNPRIAEVYNIGGGTYSNCSMIEAIKMCEEITGNTLNYHYNDENRIGDHIWWISDVSKFKKHYPGWAYKFNIKDILTEIYENYDK